jgi:predicted DNA-binding transcriptional regulator AlpA
MGRCAQDDYYLVPIAEGNLPKEIQSRFLKRIEDIIPLEDFNLLVFFRDGKVKKCSLREYFQSDKAFFVLFNKEDLFCHVQIQTGGYGVAWDINMAISSDELYQMGQKVPLSAKDFTNFVVHRVITAAEAAEILGCSRQNIDDLAKRGRLHPIKSGAKTTLFLKSEILKRNWQ